LDLGRLASPVNRSGVAGSTVRSFDPRLTRGAIVGIFPEGGCIKGGRFRRGAGYQGVARSVIFPSWLSFLSSLLLPWDAPF